MKLWVVIEESAVGGLHDFDVKLYGNRVDAIKRFEEREQLWADSCRTWMKTHATKGVGVEMWKDGSYLSNHLNLEVELKEVE